MDGQAHVVIDISVDAGLNEVTPPPSPLPPPPTPSSCASEDEECENDGAFVVKCGTCPICQEEAVAPMIILECGHTLDEECFKEYVTFELRHNKRSLLCPMCRVSFMEVEPPTTQSQPQTIVRNTQHERTQLTVELRRQEIAAEPLTFCQRVAVYFAARPGRYVGHIIFEVIFVGIILVISYIATCSTKTNCRL